MKINKNVPVPPKSGRNMKLPLDDMEVGDQLTFTDEECNRESANYQISMFKKSKIGKGRKITRRNTPTGTDIYRVE